MGWGDEIVAAGQAQRLFECDPTARVAICGLDGQPRWHPIWDGNPILATPADVARGEHVNRVISGPNCRPYIVNPFTEETGWTFQKGFRCRDYPAKLYLTAAELEVGRHVREECGPYVLIEPFTKHENFQWPLHKWDDLVQANPYVTFVQHVHDQSQRVIGVRREPATFREACGLIASADCYIRSESGLCHAAAALGTPQVTLFGGCMDADVMGGYPGQTCLVDRGAGSPCGSWRACTHCREAMDRITVDDVVEALRGCLQERRAA